MNLTPREIQGFSLGRTLTEMASDRGLHDGLEAELLTEAARHHNESFDPHRVRLPWALLTGRRDMTVAAGNQGAQLVGTATGAPVNPLGHFSVTGRLGVRVMPDLVGNVELPGMASTGANWQADESDAINEQTPSTSKVTLTPHTAGSLVEFSRRLRLQSGIDDALARHLAIRLAALVDNAFIAGTGLSGQPLGLLGQNGIGDVDGASFTWADCLSMEQSASTAAGELPIHFAAHPDVRALLAARVRGTDNNYCWQAGRISDTPAVVSTSVPSATIVCGPFSTAVIGLWGAPILEVDPFTNFKTAGLVARLLVDMDCGFTHPTAFVKADSLS
ncbi:MAG TPA: phage major capsid protein [Thiobacillaceae bacterium]|nr:phage major capsid protein [Thiobacillaceae bacterium]